MKEKGKCLFNYHIYTYLSNVNINLSIQSYLLSQKAVN